jgi:hypothetical protein
MSLMLIFSTEYFFFETERWWAIPRRVAGEMKLDVEEIVRRAKRVLNPVTEDEDGKHNTKIGCVIPGCLGKIVREVSYRYLGDPGNMIIGPGSRSQRSKSIKLYCDDCQVLYNDLPKNKPSKKSNKRKPVRKTIRK